MCILRTVSHEQDGNNCTEKSHTNINITQYIYMYMLFKQNIPEKII